MAALDDWLRSEETGEAFTHCVACRLPLLEIAAPWLVNKDYFHGECVLEYAVCQPCRNRLSARIPEVTKVAMRAFLEREIDWSARVTEFLTSHDPLIRFERCVACQAGREEMHGYAISGLYDAGGHLVTGPLPLLICRSCVGQMMDLLCETSRVVWREFLDAHFSGPPDDSGFPGLL